MRITGGTARGIPIKTGRARHVRPATDRMREAIFSSLGIRVEGARCLDLFAGSGSYGLEALSRGATGCVFVEKHPQANEALEENIRAVRKCISAQADGSRSVTKVIRRDVLRFTTKDSFDLVFMDPPYDLARRDRDRLLQVAGGCLAPGGVLVFELPGDMEVPETRWTRLRRLGKSGTNEPGVLLLKPIG